MQKIRGSITEAIAAIAMQVACLLTTVSSVSDRSSRRVCYEQMRQIQRTAKPLLKNVHSLVQRLLQGERLRFHLDAFT